MVFILLLITTFILGMISGAIVLTIIAFTMEKKEKNNGNKEESRIQTTGGNK